MVQNLDSGPWIGLWTGPWTGLLWTGQWTGLWIPLWTSLWTPLWIDDIPFGGAPNGLVSKALHVRQLLLHFVISAGAFGAGKGD